LRIGKEKGERREGKEEISEGTAFGFDVPEF